MSANLFNLAHAEARRRAMEAVRLAPDGWIVKVQEPTRSLDANAKMWVLLQAFADQLVWPVNGKMERLSAGEFKEIFSAAFHRENVRLAQGLDGGVVMLGKRTSKFSAREMSEFIEFVSSVAVDLGVDLDYREHADE